MELIMHYICIEDNKVTSILNYAPNVPSSVTLVEVSDADHQRITDQTHYFDIATRSIVAYPAEVTSQKVQEVANGLEREFLNSTDWKVLRHIREKALGITTSLTEAEYLELETQRQAAAARIA